MRFENPFTFLLEKLKDLCLAMLHPLISLLQAIKQGFEAAINFPAEKLRQLWFTLVHMWDPLINFLNVIWQGVVTDFEAVINFPAEKLRQLWSTMVHMWDPFVNWLHIITQRVEIGFQQAINFPAEKFRELWSTMVHVWDPFVRWVQKAFSPETWEDRIHNWLQICKKVVLMALENTWYPFLTWFDKVFPPETRAERLHHWFQVALPYVAVAVVAILVYCFIRFCSSLFLLIIKMVLAAVMKIGNCCYCYGSLAVMKIGNCFMYCCKRGGVTAVKMMKAPGRNVMMPRSVFEADPRGYFITLRGRP